VEPYVLLPAAGMPPAALDALAGKAVAIADTAAAVAALSWWMQGSDAPALAAAAQAQAAELDRDEAEAKRLLAEVGIAVPRGAVVNSAAEALEFAAASEGPCVLKCLRPAFAHKAAVGGVQLGLTGDGSAIEHAWEAMSKAVLSATSRRLEAALIEEQVPAGIELLASIGSDERHGSYLTLGSGGSSVEQLADVAHRLLPLGEGELESALASLSLSPSLRLAARLRGEDAVAPMGLLDLLTRLVGLADRRPGVTLELNPVILPISTGAPVAVDCLLVEAA
jgi:acyl-CoA synthetase (NDP forming)